MAWHRVQAWVVGMWFAGLLPPMTPWAKSTVEVWQLEHSPVAGWLASCALVGRSTMVTPYQVMPVSWQVMQVKEDTGVWFMPVPPKVVKLVFEWQLSQVTDWIGM